METQALVIIGTIVHLFGSMAYVRDTYLGRSQPNRVSFFLWAFAPFIGVAAALAQGVTWAVFPVFLAGFGPCMIFMASFHNKNAAWKLGKFDWVCGALSLAALVLWAITKNPNIAILFAILSDGAAALPTIKKSWTHPESETIWVYLGASFSSSTGLYLAKDMSFAEIAFPSYLIMLCGLIASLILIGKWRNARRIRVA
ncbi:MAG: hypothetical protein WC612_05955 [Bdellovibrionales bacterium]|jgi:hypothetical protein